MVVLNKIYDTIKLQTDTNQWYKNKRLSGYYSGIPYYTSTVLYYQMLFAYIVFDMSHTLGYVSVYPF